MRDEIPNLSLCQADMSEEAPLCHQGSSYKRADALSINLTNTFKKRGIKQKGEGWKGTETRKLFFIAWNFKTYYYAAAFSIFCCIFSDIGHLLQHFPFFLNFAQHFFLVLIFSTFNFFFFFLSFFFPISTPFVLSSANQICNNDNHSFPWLH